ncbi:unnamed protein product [Cylicocyclus nassatus]|uniref:PPM-type phosphatase domain-containing protein n=1 Tax=Cylicocyclus nassatus TaxID=53992 RepID=A0AA36HFB6_CYLNA|nr:unnamed protein product [Cylicocyclus nassatus]
MEPDGNENDLDVVEDFAENFAECKNSGIGSSLGARYSRNKKLPEHTALDWSVHIEENEIQMYGIFCGFNGGADVARFVMNRMVYEIFKGEHPITKTMSVEEVKGALHDKFQKVDVSYLQTREDDLTKRFFLMEDPEKNEIKNSQISALNAKIRKGTTAFVVLRLDRHLYVLNCGTSFGLAVRSDRSIVRLNPRVHDNEDRGEYERLEKLNIDPGTVFRPTRALGDYFRRDLYEELEEFANAKGSPVISDPDVYDHEIDESWKYLILLSDGVLQNLKDCGVEDFTAEVAERLKVQTNVRSTAQALVDEFSRKHYSAYCRSGDQGSNRCEEMTVIFVQLWDTNKLVDMSCGSFTDSLDATNSLLTGPLAPYTLNYYLLIAMDLLAIHYFRRIFFTSLLYMVLIPSCVCVYGDDPSVQELDMFEWSSGIRVAYCVDAPLPDLLSPFRRTFSKVATKYCHNITACNLKEQLVFGPEHIMFVEGFPRREYGAIHIKFYVVFPHNTVAASKQPRPLLPRAVLSDIISKHLKEISDRLGWSIISYEKYPRFDSMTEFMNIAIIPIVIFSVPLMIFLAYWTSSLRPNMSSEAWLVTGATGGKNAALRRTMEIIAEQNAEIDRQNRMELTKHAVITGGHEGITSSGQMLLNVARSSLTSTMGPQVPQPSDSRSSPPPPSSPKIVVIPSSSDSETSRNPPMSVSSPRGSIATIQVPAPQLLSVRSPRKHSRRQSSVEDVKQARRSRNIRSHSQAKPWKAGSLMLGGFARRNVE